MSGIDSSNAPETLEPLVDWLCEHYTNADLWFGHGTTSAIDEAAWTVSAAINLDIDDFVPERVIDADELERVLHLANQRIASRRPLAYLIGEAWFAGQRYNVDERVIVPRSHLGEWIPEQFVPWINPQHVNRIVDIGTGSGCIAIALAHAFPDAHVDATDLSADALAVARANLRRHQVEDRVTLHEVDLFPAGNFEWDLIVTNPPYVDDVTMNDLPAEYHHEPDMAFRGGPDGLDIVRRIVTVASQRLSNAGSFIIEAGTARRAMEAAWPNVQMMWLSTSSGEDGIALIDAENLRVMAKCQARGQAQNPEAS